MDDETAELIIALQLQDVEDVKSKSKGKGREGEKLSDAELAIQFQRDEYEQAKASLCDRRIANSIHKAVLDDGAKIVVLASEENNATEDRELAQRLSGQNPQTSPELNDLTTDADALVRFRDFNGVDDSVDDRATTVDGSELDEPESSSWAPTRGAIKSEMEDQQCISCQETIAVVKVSCQHLYCRDCIRHLFADATVDESLFPPRCCRQPIPVSLVYHFLDSRLAIHFEEKAIEYETPNRTYCSNITCATFIEPGRIHGSIGTCPRPGCGRQTCVLCKRESHTGDCPSDDPFSDTMRLAQEQGWQRCQRCQNLVELGIGCNHIT